MVKVIKPLLSGKRMILRSRKVFAMWDTGAATSSVSRKLAEDLDLKILERACLSTPAGRIDTFKDIVLLNLLIDDLVTPVKVAVVDFIPGENNDFLIGMDIIHLGDLSVHTMRESMRVDVSFKPYPGAFLPMEDIFPTNAKSK